MAYPCLLLDGSIICIFVLVSVFVLRAHTIIVRLPVKPSLGLFQVDDPQHLLFAETLESYLR